MIEARKDTKLHPSWEGPFLTLLTTETAVRTAEKDCFLWTLIPMYETAQAGREIQKLAPSLEEFANNTADALAETQSQEAAIMTEMIATRLKTLQNGMALDCILTEKGGTCVLTGEECCTYIPDVSHNITDISQHVRDKIAKIREASN
ncbi:syncytin-1-like [Stegostoma tigrinum]|uniref:syncytin-1-like n=1 Tax=Stegostoma tigrinum TaxID=3053191 RepID=UPI0028700097|nr:syncytin-1-like [Stegostoma tigrinum]